MLIRQGMPPEEAEEKKRKKQAKEAEDALNTKETKKLSFKYDDDDDDENSADEIKLMYAMPLNGELDGVDEFEMKSIWLISE